MKKKNAFDKRKRADPLERAGVDICNHVMSEFCFESDAVSWLLRIIGNSDRRHRFDVQKIIKIINTVDKRKMQCYLNIRACGTERKEC